MSSDNDDRPQRVTGMTPDMLQSFQNSFNSRNPIPTSTVPELNFPSPIPQNWTENLRTKVAPATTATQTLDDIMNKISNEEYDRLTLQKINELISKNLLEEAAYEFSKLNFDNLEMKEIIQQKLDDKFGQEVVQFYTYKLEEYIKSNTWKIKSINPGNYLISFDKSGWPSNMSFPSWSMLPKKEFGSFTVYLKFLEINIIVKDSILVSTTFSTSKTKPLFIDKNENFYYKTKTGLPVATISNDPSIDKKTVRINKVYKREKYANGILIDSQEFRTEKTVGIQKKDQ
jgi:hypothetical protein